MVCKNQVSAVAGDAANVHIIDHPTWKKHIMTGILMVVSKKLVI